MTPNAQLRISLGSVEQARYFAALVGLRRGTGNPLRGLESLSGSWSDIDGFMDPSAMERTVPVSSVSVDYLTSWGTGPSDSDSGDDCLVLQGRFRIV